MAPDSTTQRFFKHLGPRTRWVLLAVPSTIGPGGVNWFLVRRDSATRGHAMNDTCATPKSHLHAHAASHDSGTGVRTSLNELTATVVDADHCEPRAVRTCRTA